MKRISTFLTLIAVGLVVSPQRTDAQQYAWVPVVSNEPVAATVQSPTAYSTGVGESFTTYVGDLAEPEGDWDDSCSSKGDCGCPTCRNGEALSRMFGGAEYLHWWNKGRRLPALASTGVVPPSAVLFGNGDVGEDLNAGARFTLGKWLDDCDTSAVVIRAYGSGGGRVPFGAAGAATGTILAVPFFDLFAPPGPGALAVNAGPDAGTIFAEASNDVLGGDVYFRTLLDQGSDYRIDVLGGYQMTRIDDDLVLSTTSTNPFTTNDLFDVSNEYHAAEVGLLAEFYRNCKTIQFMAKCGVGNMRQTVGITGNSSLAGVPTAGGLFARPTNIGFYKRDVAAWSPEVSVKLIAPIGENISVTVGYTFMYWTRVALAGDQVDTRVNSQALFNGGGVDGTSFAFRDTDFWAQTIDIGLSIGY